MARYERAHLVLDFVQTLALIGTLGVALYIGIMQNRISRDLLDLNFTPSIEVTYAAHQVDIVNRGKENVWLIDSRFAGIGENLKNEVLIPPGGTYFIPADKLEAYLHQVVGEDGSTVVPWEIDIRVSNDRRYTVTTRFVAVMAKGVPDVKTQTTSIVPITKSVK